MAFITRIASGDTPCYECGKQCINVEFCDDGASYGLEESNSVSLSRNLRVSVTANPAFWGFGGVLISGWATYSNGYYDFFDGHDENHRAEKTCGGITVGPLLNEQRPDTLYRTVYDPYNITLSGTAGRRHYGSVGTIDGVNRGGAEVYLIDRPKGLVSSVNGDSQSCDDTSPTQIFRKFPENYGWGNKVNFNTKIYKNLSGAWRLISLENCHSTGNFYTPPGFLTDCSGQPKQNIIYKERKFDKYEPSQKRVKNDAASSYYNYTSGCLPDGAVAGNYTGRFPTGVSSIYRDISQSNFIQARLSYGGQSADGLRNGMSIGIKSDVESKFNNVYTIFDVQDQGSYTSVKFVGTTPENTQPSPTMSTGDFSFTIGNSGHWIAFETYDPQTCCGLDAYGVSDKNKVFSERNYHIDFRRVFNNPKNLRQSNRDTQWRHIYGFSSPIVSTQASGYGAVDYSYPSISGGYVILQSGDSLFTASSGQFIESGSPLFERYLSYCGKFYEIDRCDNATRISQSMNQMKNRNGTCYSKAATLEVFPDCITQYDTYTQCGTSTTKYQTNRLPRLSFVYRGCDFNDSCSFDASGRPLGAWKDQGSVPLDIDDLKRQLGGQEIHMFINMSDAWGGKWPGNPCPCDCGGSTEGQVPANHVSIPSPMTFPSMPNFDLDPTGHGCLDPRYQLNYYLDLTVSTGAPDPETEYCDPLHKLPEACLPRQPYTTYGYIMNLCGKENKSRKSVITEAFAKLHQDKTYTNAQPQVDINEPMYWNIVAPNPAPYAGTGNKWSEATNAGAGVTNFSQIGGSGYGFWGLTDGNNQLVAPYFCTKLNSTKCCPSDSPVSFLDYNASGTTFNVLGTHNGWPTAKVPFFIEIEVDDFCGGCVTKTMKNESLTIEFSGLDTEFIHGHGNKYGHAYCDYVTGGSYAVANVKTDPVFTCESGFMPDYCSVGDGIANKTSNVDLGNTCGCVGGFSTTLYPVKPSGSNFVIGYRSQTPGTIGGLVEIANCSNPLSRYFDSDYMETAGCGYRVFAQFSLTCPGYHQYLTDPRYPEAKYEGNSVSALWSNSNSCGRHYPARVGSDGDLELETTIYAISDKYVDLFKHISPNALKWFDISKCLSTGSFYGGAGVGIFGFCPGDKIYSYGCKPGSTFIGCDPLNDGYPGGTILECTGVTVCNSCPSGTGSGEVGCDCGFQTSYEGIDNRRVPAHYNLGGCGCKCTTPTLIASYTIGPGQTLILDSGSYAGCASVFWMGGSGANGLVIPPTLIQCSPPCPALGKKLGVFSSTDWYKYSHGVNALVTGVEYELTKPSIGNFCNQMSIPGIDAPIECSKTGCISDNNVYTKSCGLPIHATGTMPNIKVRKKKCHPEVAIVNKISCLPGAGDAGKDRYNLHISREYHEHNRIWRDKVVIEGQEVCVNHAAGAYRYNDGSCSGCVLVPYAIPADSVTPAYDAPCSIHPSSGTFVNQDFRLNSPSVCSPSGDHLWNYYNLFYDSGFPTSAYVPYVLRDPVTFGFDCNVNGSGPAVNPIFGTSSYNNPVGFKGVLTTNRKHSCVQDSIKCGGELWCNKMLFPRHSYAKNTKIAPFAAPSVCATTAEFKHALLDGYTSLNEGKYLLKEQTLRFVDWCKNESLTVASEKIDIDDVVITVDDYLPLIGVVHPGWRYTSDVKSCTSGGSGCQNTIPVHTDYSISVSINSPKTFVTHGFGSMGYYLDAVGISNTGLIKAKSSDQCLFNPFKILIDVECSTNRIAVDGITSDPPTYLKGVQSWPATACKKHRSNPACQCAQSACNFNTAKGKGTCQKFFQTTYESASGMYSPICDDGQFVCDISGISYANCSGDSVHAVKDIIPIGRWIHPDNLINVDIKGRVVSGVCYFPCPGSSGSCSGVYQYVDPSPPEENWRQSVCDGKYYQIIPGGFWVHMWQCDNYQYIDSKVYATECECELDIFNGLCGADRRCTDYSSCDCHFADETDPVPALVPSTGWWKDDCHCDEKPRSDHPCTDSVVSFTITETVP